MVDFYNNVSMVAVSLPEAINDIISWAPVLACVVVVCIILALGFGVVQKFGVKK